MNRREFLASSVFHSLSLGPSSGDNLSRAAERRGLFFGTAISNSSLAADQNYKSVVFENCSVFTPEWEQKWGEIERQPKNFRFENPDLLLNLVETHSGRMRGHTLVWAANLPKWVSSIESKREFRSIALRYMQMSLEHYKGRLFHWDVVNEPIKPSDQMDNGMRKSIHLDSFGEEYIDIAFRLAQSIDPSAKLYLNEFNLWGMSREHSDRRYHLLQLLDRLKARGVPITGVGVQGHLSIGNEFFDEHSFYILLREISALGLEITITEFDVSTSASFTCLSEACLDIQAAELTSRFLDVAFAELATKGLVVWGLSDRFSYRNRSAIINNRPDNDWRAINRCAPLNMLLQRKPIWNAILQSFENAPAR